MHDWSVERIHCFMCRDAAAGREGKPDIECHPWPEKIPLPGVDIKSSVQEETVIGEEEEKSGDKQENHLELVAVVGSEFVMSTKSKHGCRDFYWNAGRMVKNSIDDTAMAQMTNQMILNFLLLYIRNEQ